MQNAKKCKICTFINNLLMSSCEMCGTPLPTAVMVNTPPQVECKAVEKKHDNGHSLVYTEYTGDKQVRFSITEVLKTEVVEKPKSTGNVTLKVMQMTPAMVIEAKDEVVAAQLAFIDAGAAFEDASDAAKADDAACFTSRDDVKLQNYIVEDYENEFPPCGAPAPIAPRAAEVAKSEADIIAAFKARIATSFESEAARFAEQAAARDAYFATRAPPSRRP
jgi:hypothetical protein